MDTIHLETWINAPREVVFAALTTEDGLNAWWGKCLSAEPTVGHLVAFDHGLGDPLTMRITELVADQRLAWRCVSEFTDPANPASEWLGTDLTFDLAPGDDDPARRWMGPRLGHEPHTDLTILRFRHTDWPATNRWSPFCGAAWAITLDALADHCTTA
jgi:uncharacterized protein YndB with AHSA1/START domain